MTLRARLLNCAIADSCDRILYIRHGRGRPSFGHCSKHGRLLYIFCVARPGAICSGLGIQHTKVQVAQSVCAQSCCWLLHFAPAMRDHSKCVYYQVATGTLLLGPSSNTSFRAAVGSIMSIRWVTLQAVSYEPYCTAQGKSNAFA